MVYKTFDNLQYTSVHFNLSHNGPEYDSLNKYAFNEFRLQGLLPRVTGDAFFWDDEDIMSISLVCGSTHFGGWSTRPSDWDLTFGITLG